MPSVPLIPNPHGRPPVLRHYVQSIPHLFDRSSMAKLNLSHGANVICDGSPSRIRMVRRISLGMTTRPRSSMRRTIPVAFIVVQTFPAILYPKMQYPVFAPILSTIFCPVILAEPAVDDFGSAALPAPDKHKNIVGKKNSKNHRYFS